MYDTSWHKKYFPQEHTELMSFDEATSFLNVTDEMFVSLVNSWAIRVYSFRQVFNDSSPDNVYLCFDRSSIDHFKTVLDTDNSREMLKAVTEAKPGTHTDNPQGLLKTLTESKKD